MKCDADIIVVGGGPAGAAAAIEARRSGASVILLEADRYPRPRPGETIHGGATAIFRQLGVEAAVERAAGARYDSIKVNWAGRKSLDSPPTQPSKGGPPGFQVGRASLDELLIERAESLGVDVRRPCRALRPLIDGAQIVGVRTDRSELTATVLIDASGVGFWLSKGISLREERASPRLIARYGYCRSSDVGEFHMPTLTGDRAGWEWVAVEGDAEVMGPDDTFAGVDDEVLRRLLREAFTAAGGTHEDWDEYDRVMAEDRRAVVLITPSRVYSNG